MKGRLLKYGSFLTLWIILFGLIFCFDDSRFNSTIQSHLDFDIPPNQIGRCSYVRFDSENDGRPLYSFCFDQLILDNNTLGIFKSAIHQIIFINNLKIKSFNYSQENSEGNNITSMIGNIISLFKFDYDGWKIDNFDIDSKNVSEILINGFKYTFIKDKDIVITIQSKRAIISYKNPGLTLRGDVVIETNNERVLHSNHVAWDLNNDYFDIKGVYALNSGGQVTTGQSAQLDYQLNPFILVNNTDNSQEEQKPCYARLY